MTSAITIYAESVTDATHSNSQRCNWITNLSISKMAGNESNAVGNVTSFQVS